MIRGLNARFIIIVVLILTTAISVSSYLHLRIQYTQLLDMSKEKLTDLVEVIEKSIQSSMLEGNSEEVRNIIRHVGTLPDLERVRIFSKTGTIILSSDSSEVGEKIHKHDLEIFHNQKFSPVFNQKNLKQPIFYVLKPLLNKPECFECHGNVPNEIIGVLEVDVSMAKIHQRLAKARDLMVTSTTVTIVLLILSIIFLLQRLVKNPIDRLIQTMRIARRGDLKVRVIPDDTLEFEELGQNFNEMISRLELAQQDLQAIHDEQLERADRLATLGELAAGIAHEIKNPIAGISGAMQILMKDFDKDDEKRIIIKEILKQIERINRDVKDLLCYAKTAKPELARKDVNGLIEESIFLIKELAAQHHVEVKNTVDSSIPIILIDEKQIQQVLVNLELNAIQAMPDGGVLTITPRLTIKPAGDEYVEIEVKDTGAGIEPEKLAKIFNPFFTTRHTGTGLGLSISQNMVREHRGRLEVSSEPGKGSIFVIILPIAAPT